MGLVTDPYPDFQAGQPAVADQVDARFAAILAQLNGNLDDANVKDAGLSAAKLASRGVARLLGAVTLSSFSIGASVLQVIGTVVATHTTGATTIWVVHHHLFVTGASPYGVAFRALMDGGIAASYSAGDASTLSRSTGIGGVSTHTPTAGSHTWQFRIESGSNPNTWESPGGGPGFAVGLEMLP